MWGVPSAMPCYIRAAAVCAVCGPTPGAFGKSTNAQRRAAAIPEMSGHVRPGVHERPTHGGVRRFASRRRSRYACIPGIGHPHGHAACARTHGHAPRPRARVSRAREGRGPRAAGRRRTPHDPRPEPERSGGGASAHTPRGRGRAAEPRTARGRAGARERCFSFSASYVLSR